MPRGNNSEVISIKTSFDGAGATKATAAIRSLSGATSDLGESSKKNSAIAQEAIGAYGKKTKASQDAVAALRAEIETLNGKLDEMSSKNVVPLAKNSKADIEMARNSVQKLDRDLDRVLTKPRKPSKGLNLSFKNLFNAGINTFGAVTAGFAIFNAIQAIKKPINQAAAGKGNIGTAARIGSGIGMITKEAGNLTEGVGGAAIAFGKILRAGKAIGPVANVLRDVGSKGTAAGFVIAGLAKTMNYSAKMVTMWQRELKLSTGETMKLSEAIKAGYGGWNLALLPVRTFGKVLQSTGTSMTQFGRLTKSSMMQPLGLGVAQVGKAIYSIGLVGKAKAGMVSQTVQDGKKVVGAGRSMVNAFTYMGKAFNAVPIDAAKAVTRLTNLVGRTVDATSKATRVFKEKDHPLSGGFQSMYEAVKDRVSPEGMGEKIKNAVDPAKIDLQWFARNKTIWETFVDGARIAMNQVKEIFTASLSTLKGLFSSLLPGFFKGLSGGFSNFKAQMFGMNSAFASTLHKMTGATKNAAFDMGSAIKMAFETFRSDDIINSVAKGMDRIARSGVKGIFNVAASGSMRGEPRRTPIRTNDLANATILLREMSKPNRDPLMGLVSGLAKVRLYSAGTLQLKEALDAIANSIKKIGVATGMMGMNGSRSFDRLKNSALIAKANIVAAFRIVNFGSAALDFATKMNSRLREMLGLGPKVQRSLAQTASQFLMNFRFAVFFAQQLKNMMNKLVISNLTEASNLEEAESKFGFAFGAEAQANIQWVDEYTRAVGRSRVGVVTWMADIQNVVGALGFSDKEAAKFSRSLTSLAVDLESFSNIAGGTQGVVQSLIGGITGETENLKKFGVVIREADLEVEALRIGMEKNGSTFEGAQKAQLIYNILMQRTAKAQGDAVRTGASYANVVRKLQASFQNMKVTIGTAMRPAATTITTYFQGLFERIGKALTGDSSTWTTVFQSFADKLVISFRMIEGKLAQIKPDTIQKVVDFIGDMVVKIVDVAIALSGLLVVFRMVIDVFLIVINILNSIPASLAKIVIGGFMIISFVNKLYNYIVILSGIVKLLREWSVFQKIINGLQFIFNAMAAANPYVLLASVLGSMLVAFGAFHIAQRIAIKDAKDLEDAPKWWEGSGGKTFAQDEADALDKLAQKYDNIAAVQARINLLAKDKNYVADTNKLAGTPSGAPVALGSEYTEMQRLVKLRGVYNQQAEEGKKIAFSKVDLYRKSGWYLDAINESYKTQNDLALTGFAYAQYLIEAEGEKKNVLKEIIVNLNRERDFALEKMKIEMSLATLNQKRGEVAELLKSAGKDEKENLEEQLVEIDKQVVGMKLIRDNWDGVDKLVSGIVAKVKTLTEVQSEMSKGMVTSAQDKLLNAVSTMNIYLTKFKSGMTPLDRVLEITNPEERLNALQAIFDATKIGVAELVALEDKAFAVEGSEKLEAFLERIKRYLADAKFAIEAVENKLPTKGEARISLEKEGLSAINDEANKRSLLIEYVNEENEAHGERLSLIGRIIKSLKDELGITSELEKSEQDRKEKAERVLELVKQSREYLYDGAGGALLKAIDDLALAESTLKEAISNGLSGDQLEGFKKQVADLKKQVAGLKSPFRGLVEMIDKLMEGVKTNVPQFDKISMFLKGMAQSYTLLGVSMKKLMDFSGFSGMMASITNTMKSVVVKISESVIGQWIGSAVKGVASLIGPYVKPIVDSFSGFAKAAYSAGSMLTEFANYLLSIAINSEQFQVVMTALKDIIEQAVLPVVTALINALMPLLVFIGYLAQIVSAFLVPIIKMLGVVVQALTPLFVSIAMVVVELFKAFMPLIEFAMKLAIIVGRVLAPILNALGYILRPIGMILKDMEPVLDATGMALSAVGRVVSTLAILFGFLLSNLIAFGRLIGKIVTLKWDKLGNNGGMTVEEMGEELKKVWSEEWNPDLSAVEVDMSVIEAALAGIGDLSNSTIAASMLSAIGAGASNSSVTTNTSNATAVRQPDVYNIVEINGSTVVQGLDTMRIVTIQDIMNALTRAQNYQAGLSG